MAAASGVEEASAPVKITLEQLRDQAGVPVQEEYANQVETDLGNLTASDPTPVDAATYAATNPDREEVMKQQAEALAQVLTNQLFQLPSESVKGGRLAQLPSPSIHLPREKPLPAPKPLTKWQRFAQQKGIVKRKRSKLAWDDTAQEWRRRHGYKRVNDESEIPIIEARSSDQPGEDPFSRMAAEKKERVKMNKAQQLDNVKAAAKVGALPATVKLASVLPAEGRTGAAGKKGSAGKLTVAKRKELKDEIRVASRLSGVSTASMGKFDKRLEGEKAGERAPLGKRRKFMSATDTAAERNKISSAADRFLRERSEDVLDVRKAIGKFEAEAREERRADKEAFFTKGPKGGKKGGKKQQRGGGEEGGSKGGKGRPPKGPGGVKGGGVSKGRPQQGGKGGKGRPQQGGKGGRGGKGKGR